MAYQFSCGFDDITTASQKWTTVSGSVVISSANARFGGTHSQGCGIPKTGFLGKTLASSQATLIMGCAIKLPTLPTGSTDYLFDFADAGNAQVVLNITSGGVLQFFRGPMTAAIGSTGSTSFTAGVWHFLEALVTISGTVGVAQCWLDGVQIINSSGLNTKATANSTCNGIFVGDINNSTGTANNGIVIDDLYCFDSTGSAPLNGQLGDGRFVTPMPNAAGSFTQMTPTGAASNWDCVDEIPPDDATTYVSDATVGHRDSYTHEALSFNGNAVFMVPWARIAKDDTGAHTVKLTLTDTGNDALSSAITVPTSFTYVNGGAITTSPNGAAALSQTVVNRMEVGIEIIS